MELLRQVTDVPFSASSIVCETKRAGLTGNLRNEGRDEGAAIPKWEEPFVDVPKGGSSGFRLLARGALHSQSPLSSASN
jgi:hypothetical protein